MVEIFEIDYGTSWKLRRRCWIRNGEEVELYLPKTSDMIYRTQIAPECDRATSSATQIAWKPVD